MSRFCASCGHESAPRAENLFVCDQGHQDWINPIPGSTVFVMKDEHVLYGVRGGTSAYRGMLNLPGGFIDMGESAEKAAEREVLEELGITVEVTDFIGSYPDIYEDGRPTLNLFFVARFLGGVIKPSDDLNGGEPVWRHVTKLPAQDEVAWACYPQAQADLLAWWRKQNN